MTATLAPDGLVEPGFGRVADAFRANLDDHGDVGAACCVYLDGDPVVDIWGGLADRASGRPWARDTIVIVFSCTKGVTAVAANQLIAAGRLDPDAPIADYWPEFAANGKAAITVGMALSHRAGLAAVDGDLTLADIAAWDPVVAAIAAQAPNWEPGTAHGYHSRSYGWIVGELIRRVSGHPSPGAYIAAEIAAPLGLDFFLGVPEDEDARVATLYPAPNAAALDEFAAAHPESLFSRVFTGPSGLLRYDDQWNTRLLRAAQLPSSNGHGTATALARMYAACLQPLDGTRLLSDEALDRATQVRSDGPDVVLGQPLTFGLGFALPPTLGPGAGPRSFGHPGAGGSLGYADRESGLAFAYVMNQMRFDPPGPETRADRLSAAASACAT
jgi:CubicO group peptidase (beta-lactamase class C family)